MVRTAPVVAVLFLVPAMSLVGIPPLSGFVAKFALVDAAIDASSYGVVAVALVVSLLTLYSLMKIWIAVFWAPAREGPAGVGTDRSNRADRTARADWADHDERLGGPLLMIAPTAMLAAMTLAIGLAAGPLYDLSLRAAEDLLDPSSYIAEVAP
jgi:multicomponent Na+:H+ antiporter subunit D